MKSFTVSSDGDIRVSRAGRGDTRITMIYTEEFRESIQKKKKKKVLVLLEGVRHAVLAQGGKQVDGRQVGQGRDYCFGGGASLVDVPSSRVVL